MSGLIRVRCSVRYLVPVLHVMPRCVSACPYQVPEVYCQSDRFDVRQKFENLYRAVHILYIAYEPCTSKIDICKTIMRCAKTTERSYYICSTLLHGTWYLVPGTWYLYTLCCQSIFLIFSDRIMIMANNKNKNGASIVRFLSSEIRDV
jgi:hypothetical protein